MTVDVSGERLFIGAVVARVRSFAASRDCETPAVRVTLGNGERFLLAGMEPEPGGGMITLSPIPDDLGDLVESAPSVWVTPTQLIVRISDIRSMELLVEAPEEVRVGFQLPDDDGVA